MSADDQIADSLRNIIGAVVPIGGAPSYPRSQFDLSSAPDFGPGSAPDESRPLPRAVTPDIEQSMPRRHPFEIIIAGYTSAAMTTINAQVAWGSVLKTDSVTDGATIVAFDTPFTLTSGDKVWLAADFTLSGTVNSITLKKGVPASEGWTDYPVCWKDNGASGNIWYQLLGVVRAFKTRYGGAGVPDSGENALIETGLTLAQCTHTHLVKRRKCVTDTLNLLWTLEPGMGAAN